MAEVEVGQNESIESALKRFKKKIQKAGILSEIKRRERHQGKTAKFGVRPEDLRLATEGEEALYSCEIRIIEKLGEVTLLYLEPPQAGDEPLIAKIPGTHDFVRGQTISLTADNSKRHLFTQEDQSFRWLGKE